MARDPGAFGSGGGRAVPAPTPREVASQLSSGEAATPLSTADVAAFLNRLPTLDPGVPDSERVDQLALLEAVKAAAAGAQAKVAVAFAASQVEAQAAEGVPARERGRGVAGQVALARRESAHAGSRHLGLAQALHTELPHTRAHLSAGRVSEWAATVVCRETAHLDPELRGRVDAAVATDLPSWSPQRTEREVRALAQRLDPAAAVARGARAMKDRRVTLRPAPDTMAILTATLPVTQGVAAYAALTRAADEATATGAAGARTRSQVLADILVERLTGQANAAAVPIEIQLVMTDTTLLCGGDEPAHLPGHGPLPAALARRLLRGSLSDTADTSVETSGDTMTGTTADATGNGARGAGERCPGCASRDRQLQRSREQAAVWVRRLYTSPDGAALVALDSRRRVFDGGLRRFLITRDQTCRTPWCDAPIREGDHARPHRAGGPTTATNGQGLCKACNRAKEAPGWSHHVTDLGPPGGAPAGDGRQGWEPGRRHTVQITTPTGHTYESAAPRPAGWDPWGRTPSALEQHLSRLIAA